MFFRRKHEPVYDGPFWTQRSWQLSAAFLAIVLVVGAVAVVVSGGDDAAPASNKSPLSVSSLTPEGRPLGCHTDDTTGETVPKDVTWKAIGVSKVPVSPTAGPTHTTGTPWWCFAHTPVGAVIAAHSITAQMSEAGWKTVAQEQLMPGEGRNLFVFRRKTISGTGEERSRDATDPSSYAGFKVRDYDAKEATVTLLIKNSQGFMATSIDLEWSGGDWKIVVNGNGTLYSGLTAVQNAAGYHLWGA